MTGLKSLLARWLGGTGFPVVEQRVVYTIPMTRSSMVIPMRGASLTIPMRPRPREFEIPMRIR